MFYFDPIYMVIAVFGLILTLIPQMLVKNTFKSFSQVATRRGMTGAQVAQALLSEAGVNDVVVESTEGSLTDHYDPTVKVLRLSQEIYNGRSIAASGIAAHEVGHAIQDNRGYMPMKLRAGFVPIVQVSQMLGPILLMAGFGLRAVMNIGGFSDIIALAGIALYGAAVLFQIITLPVEFDASFRAIRALSSGGYLVEDENVGAKKVLTAAALTYVAAALYALIELLYWVWMLFGRSRD